MLNRVWCSVHFFWSVWFQLFSVKMGAQLSLDSQDVQDGCARMWETTPYSYSGRKWERQQPFLYTVRQRSGLDYLAAAAQDRRPKIKSVALNSKYILPQGEATINNLLYWPDWNGVQLQACQYRRKKNNNWSRHIKYLCEIKKRGKKFTIKAVFDSFDLL